MRLIKLNIDLSLYRRIQTRLEILLIIGRLFAARDCTDHSGPHIALVAPLIHVTTVLALVYGVFAAHEALDDITYELYNVSMYEVLSDAFPTGER